jgi:hypothetical protein
MILGPLAAWGISNWGGFSDWDKLCIEWAGIWVFGIYWLVKTLEISLSKADEMAAKGDLTTADPTGQLIQAGSRLLRQSR